MRRKADPSGKTSAAAAERRSARLAAPSQLLRSQKTAAHRQAWPLGRALASMTALRPGLKVPDCTLMHLCYAFFLSVQPCIDAEELWVHL